MDPILSMKLPMENGNEEEVYLSEVPIASSETLKIFSELGSTPPQSLSLMEKNVTSIQTLYSPLSEIQNKSEGERTKEKILGVLTIIGAVALTVGWIFLSIVVWRKFPEGPHPLGSIMLPLALVPGVATFAMGEYVLQPFVYEQREEELKKEINNIKTKKIKKQIIESTSFYNAYTYNRLQRKLTKQIEEMRQTIDENNPLLKKRLQAKIELQQCYDFFKKIRITAE